jgi:hypothetical protein
LEKWKAKRLYLLTDKIIAHIELMKTTRKWKDGYEPAPQTYINQEHWNDGNEPEQPKPRGLVL